MNRRSPIVPRSSVWAQIGSISISSQTISGPTQIQRRLVAMNGKVYLPLGALAPISELDGRTGKVLKTYEDTSNVDEILIDGDQMIVQMGEQVVRREGFVILRSRIKIHSLIPPHFPL